MNPIYQDSIIINIPLIVSPNFTAVTNEFTNPSNGGGSGGGNQGATRPSFGQIFPRGIQ